MPHHKPNHKTKLSDLADVRRSLLDFEQMPQSDRSRQRLVELRAFVRQLEATEIGKKDLERRRNRYGDCTQEPDESDSSFYGRLRTWLDHGDGHS